MTVQIDFWGSSSVTGAGDENEKGFVGYFTDWVSGLPFRVVVRNHGIVAQNSTQTRIQFIKEFPDFLPEYAILFLGTNDTFRLKTIETECSIPVSELKQSLEEITQLVKIYKRKIIFLTPYPRDDNKNPTNPQLPLKPGYIMNNDIVKRVKLLEQFCREKKILSIDLWNESSDWISMLEPEGLHVNHQGHLIIAQKLISYFKLEFAHLRPS